MNKYVKKGLCLALAVGMIATSFAGCKKVNYVTNGAIEAIHQIKDGTWEKQEEVADPAGGSDNALVIEEFAAGTYGGVEFKSIEDVTNFYVEAYNYSKTLMADYKDKEGNVYANNEKSEYSELLRSYQILQYNQLFDKENRQDDFFFLTD